MKCRHCINKIVAPWFLIPTKEVKLPLHLVKKWSLHVTFKFLAIGKMAKMVGFVTQSFKNYKIANPKLNVY